MGFDNVTVDPVSVKGRVPRLWLPSMKVTLPVGLPAPGDMGATAAVKLMGWPTVNEPECARVVTVLALLVMNPATWSELAANAVFPAYVAVIVWGCPALKLVISMVACPFESGSTTGAFESTTKLTDPLTPVPVKGPVTPPLVETVGATTAVKYTGCPNTEELTDPARCVVVEIRGGPVVEG